MNRQILPFLFLLIAVFILAGCGAAAVGGAAAYGGYKVSTDERSVGTIIDDSIILSSVKSKMISDEFIKSRHIEVDVSNGVVTLTGVAESSSQRRMAGDIARSVEGVRKVENKLVVGN